MYQTHLWDEYHFMRMILTDVSMNPHSPRLLSNCQNSFPLQDCKIKYIQLCTRRDSVSHYHIQTFTFQQYKRKTTLETLLVFNTLCVSYPCGQCLYLPAYSSQTWQQHFKKFHFKLICLNFHFETKENVCVLERAFYKHPLSLEQLQAINLPRSREYFLAQIYTHGGNKSFLAFQDVFLWDIFTSLKAVYSGWVPRSQHDPPGLFFHFS